MKILFPIGAFYPSQIGGPCNTLYWHTRALFKKGVYVNICTTTLGIKKGEVKEDEKIEAGCGTVYYGNGNYNTVRIVKKALMEIKDADIVHLNSFFDLLSISSFFYLKFFYPNKKIVWSVRGQLNSNALIFSSIKKKPLIFLYKLFRRNILFHTSSEAETLDTLKIFKGAKTIELPNFIEPSKRLEIPKKKQILFVGRIHPIKAIHKLIKALALCKTFIDLDFMFVVAGVHEPRHQYYMDDLQELLKTLGLKEKVEFRGHIRGIEKEKLYAESYVLVLPSETENFGNVVVEALNQRTPVIASKGTPWGILEKFNCGFHVDHEPEVLSLAIDKMLCLESHVYEKMQKSCINLVDREFDISSNINQWMELYGNLISHKKKV